MADSSFRYADRTVLVVLANGIKAFADVLTGIVLARLLSQNDFGSYRQLLLLFVTLAGLTGMGLPQALLFFVPRRRDGNAPAFIARIYIGILSLTVPGVVILGLFGERFSRAFENPGLGQLIWIGGLYPIGMLLGQCLPLLFLGLNRHMESALATVSFSLLQGTSIILAAFLGGDLKIIIVVLGSVSCVVSVVSIGFTYSIMRKWKHNRTRGATAELMRYSLPLGAHSAIGNFNQRLDRFLISFFFRPQVLAVYSVGAFAEPILSVLLDPIHRVLIPRFVEIDQSGRRQEILPLWHRYIIKMGVLVFFIFCILFAVAPELLVILYGAEYSESAGIFRIYLLLLPFRVTSFGAVLQGLGDTRSILRGTILSLFLGTTMGLALIHLIGWYGPALAMVLTQIIRIFYLLNRIRIHLGSTWRDLWPWSEWGRLIFAAIISSGLGMTAGVLPAGPGISLVIWIGVFLAVFPFLVWKLGLLDRRDWELARRWLTLKMFS